MLPRHAISDENWERIKDLLSGKESDPGVTARDNRLFIDAAVKIPIGFQATAFGSRVTL